MERDIIIYLFSLLHLYFNSHAHVERDVGSSSVGSSSVISTHTLTWSVTALISRVSRARKISTHTLTWSVTGIIEIACVVLVNFNSHAHVERDIPRGQERQLYLISTHTLTWSVT